MKKIAKDSAWVLALNSVNYASSFVIAVIISRLLGIEELGEYTYIVAAASVLFLISDFGSTTLLVRKIGENKSEASGLIRELNSFKLVLCTITTLLLVAIAVSFKFQYTGAVFFTGIASTFPRLIQASYESSIRVFGIQKYPSIARSSNSLLQIAGSFAAISAGYGLAGVFAVILLFEIITAMVFGTTNRAVLKKNGVINGKGKLDLSSFKTLMKECSPFFAYNFLRLSSQSLGVFLLEYMRSASAVGIYSAGARFASGIGLFSGAFYNSFYPFISSFPRDTDSKHELTKKLVSYSALFAFAAMAFLILLSGPLIDMTFKIAEAQDVLKIISLTVLPILLYPFLQSYFISMHSEKFLLQIFAVGWVINLLLTLVLIKFYSYDGLAISIVITEYLMLFVLLAKFRSAAADK